MKTNAVFFLQADKFELAELELVDPGPRDLVVETLVSAISPGTERWILRGKHIGTRFPCVPGYQRIGVVRECGADVTTFSPGDIVYGSEGRWKNEIFSSSGAHVGLSVGDCDKYRFVASSIPRRMDLDAMVFAVLGGVAHRGIRFCEVKPGEKIFIIGDGIIGICAAQFAAMQGAVPVLLGSNQERVEFVKKIIPQTYQVAMNGLDGCLKEIAPGGFDTLYDSVGHANTTNRMIAMVRKHGKLLLQAQYFDMEKCAIDLDQIKIKEITIKATCGTDDQDWLSTSNAIRNRILKISPLITHRIDAAEALKGYELLRDGRPFNLGIVFRWDARVK